MPFSFVFLSTCYTAVTRVIRTSSPWIPDTNKLNNCRCLWMKDETVQKNTPFQKYQPSRRRPQSLESPRETSVFRIRFCWTFARFEWGEFKLAAAQLQRAKRYRSLNWKSRERKRLGLPLTERKERHCGLKTVALVDYGIFKLVSPLAWQPSQHCQKTWHSSDCSLDNNRFDSRLDKCELCAAGGASGSSTLEKCKHLLKSSVAWTICQHKEAALWFDPVQAGNW